MKKFMVYAVIFIVVFEIYAEIKKRLTRKRLSREYGRVSKWDMKRHVDIGKLISLVIVAGGGIFSHAPYKKAPDSQYRKFQVVIDPGFRDGLFKGYFACPVL